MSTSQPRSNLRATKCSRFQSLRLAGSVLPCSRLPTTPGCNTSLRRHYACLVRHIPACWKNRNRVSRTHAIVKSVESLTDKAACCARLDDCKPTASSDRVACSLPNCRYQHTDQRERASEKIASVPMLARLQRARFVPCGGNPHHDSVPTRCRVTMST